MRGRMLLLVASVGLVALSGTVQGTVAVAFDCENDGCPETFEETVEADTSTVVGAGQTAERRVANEVETVGRILPGSREVEASLACFLGVAGFGEEARWCDAMEDQGVRRADPEHGLVGGDLLPRGPDGLDPRTIVAHAVEYDPCNGDQLSRDCTSGVPWDLVPSTPDVTVTVPVPWSVVACSSRAGTGPGNVAAVVDCPTVSTVVAELDGPRRAVCQDVLDGSVTVCCEKQSGNVTCRGGYYDGGPGRDPDATPRQDPGATRLAATHDTGRRAVRLAESIPSDPGSVAGSKVTTPAPSPSDLPIWVLATVAAALVAGAVVLYRRLQRDELLDNDLREAIVDIVAAEPGVPVQALADRLDVALNTVLYHVRILAEYDLLVVREVDGRQSCFDPSTSTRSSREALATLADGPKRDLVELLATSPGMSLSEAARRLDRDPSTVKYHADQLIARGLLEDRRDGWARQLVVPDDIRRVLADR